MLRWFPTLTTAALAPGAGTVYGQYRTDATVDGSDGGWLMPADGQNITLNFLTIAAGGSVPNAAGIANLTVVPEPSTYGMLSGGAMLGVALYRRRNRRAARQSAG